MRSEHSPDVSFGTIEFLFAGKAVSLSDIIDQVKKACLNKAHNLTSMLSLMITVFTTNLKVLQTVLYYYICAEMWRKRNT